MREGIRYDWIIAVSNSADRNGLKILKTYGKVSEIKKILVDLAKRDAKKDINSFKHGTDDISQLQVVNRMPRLLWTWGLLPTMFLIHIIFIILHTSLNTKATVNRKMF